MSVITEMQVDNSLESNRVALLFAPVKDFSYPAESEPRPYILCDSVRPFERGCAGHHGEPRGILEKTAKCIGN